MTRIKLRIQSTLLTSITVWIFLSGCIKSDGEECTQKLIVSFYSKTTCRTDTIYPGQIDDMLLCVFDRNEVLVTYRQRNDVHFSKEYTEEIETGSGLFSVIAWSGINPSYFDVNELEAGITKKSDLLFRLNRAQGQFSFMEGAQVYSGESPVVYIEEKRSESTLTTTAVNMLEITNRLTVLVEGLDQDPDKYEIYIESDNGSMSIDGRMLRDETNRYASVPSFELGTLRTDFTLLKLETGLTYTLVINDKTANQELYRGSLLGTLLLKNPAVNLNCDHDFTIRFTAEDQCDCGTYTVMEIWVNNWLVHSYNADM